MFMFRKLCADGGVTAEEKETRFPSITLSLTHYIRQRNTCPFMEEQMCNGGMVGPPDFEDPGFPGIGQEK